MNRSAFSLFETSWSQLGEVALAAVLAYLAIILIVRVNGSRTTSQLNSFDWIINVMIGSLAASGVLLEDVSLLAALVAIVVLTGLQFLLTWVTRKSSAAEAVVKQEPVLLTHKGQFLERAMTKTRISKDEIMTALRGNGMTSVRDANWVVLETNGTLSVIPRQDDLSIEDADAVKDMRMARSLRNG
ncbi:DUF421 domain-containing protein [Aurantiacibacter odishensis]|uniref:DUF421 domain-containing protein n=1 Tax=Aurantiacibacter odishensis TaxID=1155476 RepID=UPI000E7099B0|nr:YetF domain-containing protein [Aurantiacibacter odishensis]